jgi:diguanylate cyclase (GGDEF)-like protein
VALDPDADPSQGPKPDPAYLRQVAGGSGFNRLILGSGAVALLLINLAVGLFAREQQRAIISKAMEIYDTAFVSSNYIHRAQVSFQHFVDDRLRAADVADISAANAQLSDVLDQLDVVAERAPSDRARADGKNIRTQVAALSDVRESAAQLQTRLTDVQSAMEGLDRRTSAIGLHARDEIDALSTKNDFVLLGSIATSIMLAGLTLVLLRRAVARNTMARMTHLASFDSLTGLPNRTLFHAQLALGLKDLRRDNGSFALLSLDLDRFKYVNDTLGHHTGDLLLVEVARRVEEALRSSDMIARFGGDEFVVMQTPGSQPVEAGALAERLIVAISRPYTIDGHQVLIGASVGIAMAPQDGKTVEELLRHSDVALYKAKAEGKGRFRFFKPEMNSLMQARRMMEIDLRAAIDTRQLDVYFQPLMDVSTGRISACEALVRWTHPTRGPVPPNDFIPLAEETGLIIAIGEHVLRTACKEAASWTHDLLVAVNLSSVQFRAGDLPAQIASILNETGLEAKRLELEITESILIEDKDHVMEMLTAIRSLGVRIALDDFGTGYSSLSYLSSFPFDKIKIDRSFIRDVPDRPDSAAIVRAILTLAETLEMSTTAEGVERVEELDWLREHGCDQAQGFLFSRAVPARDLALLLGMNGAKPSGEPKSPGKAA